jgi:hypothetical protein
VTVRHWLLNVCRLSRCSVAKHRFKPEWLRTWRRVLPSRTSRCGVRCLPSSVPETLELFCHYCGSSSGSSFVLAGFRIATLVHAICDCEGSHFVEPKERDCGAGRATGDLVNTFGRCFHYPLQCCDKMYSRALRTVDACMCCHILTNYRRF